VTWVKGISMLPWMLQGSPHVSTLGKCSMKSSRQCLHINEVNNGSRVLGFAFLLVVQLKQSSYVTISSSCAAIVIPLITVLPPNCTLLS